MKSGVFDKNGKELQLSDKVQFVYFNVSHENAEDSFGVEPQNSWSFVERSLTLLTGEVVYLHGAFCLKFKAHDKEIIEPLYNIIEKSVDEVIDFLMCEGSDETYPFVEYELSEYPDIVEWFTDEDYDNHKNITYELVFEKIKEKFSMFEIID